MTSNPQDNDEGKPRDTWDSQMEFLLSCVAMSVGLGNVWRFPFTGNQHTKFGRVPNEFLFLPCLFAIYAFTAYENGGGAFLVPYFIVLLVFGRPMYYLEMCLGQFSSIGPVNIWEISPIFKGFFS